MKQFIITVLLLTIAIHVHSQSNTVQVEYFLDADSGFGMNTVLDIASPDIDITEAVLADIPASTSVGYHKLYIRAKDIDGNWSHTVRKNIEIFAPVENNVIEGEYFIDLDSEFGVANTFNINPQTQEIQQEFIAQILQTVTLGYHKLYGRVKDAYGNWSHTFRKNIEVYLNPVTNIVEIEYFFEDDLQFGNNTLVAIDEPDVDGTWTFDISYPFGEYDFEDVLFVRVKDSNENWSITTILDEIEVLGVEDNLQREVQVSPNPFRESIYLEIPNYLELKSIMVFDISGKKVYSSSNYLRKLELSNLQAGTYILRLSTEKQKAIFKIVKQ